MDNKWPIKDSEKISFEDVEKTILDRMEERDYTMWVNKSFLIDYLGDMYNRKLTKKEINDIPNGTFKIIL